MDSDRGCRVETVVASDASTTPAQERAVQSGTDGIVSATTRQLILRAVLRGMFLDEPWRHAYLRDRWIGQ